MQKQKQVFDKKESALLELDRLLEKSMAKIRKRNQDFIAKSNHNPESTLNSLELLSKHGQ